MPFSANFNQPFRELIQEVFPETSQLDGEMVKKAAWEVFLCLYTDDIIQSGMQVGIAETRCHEAAAIWLRLARSYAAIKTDNIPDEARDVVFRFAAAILRDASNLSIDEIDAGSKIRLWTGLLAVAFGVDSPIWLIGDRLAAVYAMADLAVGIAVLP